MKIKEGVQLLGITVQLVLAASVAESIYRRKEKEAVITCAVEGNHKSQSAHSTGRAIDLRTRDFPPNVANEVKKELKEALGSEFDVILESNHIHVEWDPMIILYLR